MNLHLCHAPDGVTVLGLGHAACNIREAAIRGNQQQRRQRQRQRRTTERSHLKW
jgi:hypothetical protein